MRLVKKFGSLSGLLCQWKGMIHAVFIGSDRIPDEFADFDWHWESLGILPNFLAYTLGKALMQP
jgi:hypothetical protein